VFVFFSGAIVVVAVVVYKFSASCCFNNYHVTSVMAFFCLLEYPKCIFEISVCLYKRETHRIDRFFVTETAAVICCA
jgi:hypothetical protein